MDQAQQAKSDALSGAADLAVAQQHVVDVERDLQKLFVPLTTNKTQSMFQLKPSAKGSYNRVKYCVRVYSKSNANKTNSANY